MTLRTIALLAAALAQHDPPLLTLLVVGCAHWLHAMHPCRHYRPGETDGVEGNGIWPVQSGERSVHAVRQRHGGYGKRTVRRSRFGSDSGRPPDVTPYKIWFFLPPLLISVQALQNS
jgi:hypothetical protein